ncbi:hypothetical protein KSP40_PGU005381 [Platanthera guangdongensis]|uniref:Uncharacterized protein n=1 Tax=Platanthera guangdongensis TaxID=2320717 RepID=A0ABR2MXC9_9ASPA
MRITQFLCFTPNFSKEETRIIQSKPELSISKRHCRRRRHSGSVFPIHGWSPEMNCSAPTGQDGRSATESDDKGFCESILPSSYSISSPRASSSSSSSSQSFSALESKGASEDPVRWSALCFLVVSLIVMVFLGRICAIVWTASGLWFLPRRMSAPGRPELRGSEMLAVGSLSPTLELRRKVLYECEKRRVVLEGFLGRNKRAPAGGIGGSKPGFRTGGEEAPLQTEFFAPSEVVYRANAAGGCLVTHRPAAFAPNDRRNCGTK